MTPSRAPADRFLPGLLVFWAGLSAGVAFLATPVKFLAPSLALSVALDVGRATFRAYNATEMVLLAFTLILGVTAASKMRWYGSLAIPALVVGLQSLWLLPALDERVVGLLAGGSERPPSQLHSAYVWLEVLKVAALLAFGLSQLRSQGGRTRRRGA